MCIVVGIQNRLKVDLSRSTMLTDGKELLKVLARSEKFALMVF